MKKNHFHIVFHPEGLSRGRFFYKKIASSPLSQGPPTVRRAPGRYTYPKSLSAFITALTTLTVGEGPKRYCPSHR
jgi:hypothetical protein